MISTHNVTYFFLKIYFTHEKQPEVQAIAMPMFRLSYFRQKHKKHRNLYFILFIIKHLYNIKYKNAFVKIVILKIYLKRKGM